MWKDGVGIAELVNLLSNKSEKISLEMRNNVPTPLITQCHHLRPHSKAQLSRFHTYPPFIQKFHLCIKADDGCASWEALVGYVPTQPLLPNLRTLVISSAFKVDSSKFLRRLDAFLCLTLSDIHATVEHDEYMDPELARHLLALMAHTCLDLRRVLLLTRNLKPSGKLRRARASLFAPIGQFRNLRSIYGNYILLDPYVLRLVGNLPHFESLTVIRDADDDQDLVANFAFPTDSFFTLRHLRIEFISNKIVAKLWHAASLARNLVSVAVVSGYGSTEHLNNLTYDIYRGSSLVTDLDLDLVSDKEVKLSTTIMDCFRQLPLQRVRV